VGGPESNSYLRQQKTTARGTEAEKEGLGEKKSNLSEEGGKGKRSPQAKHGMTLFRPLHRKKRSERRET